MKKQIITLLLLGTMATSYAGGFRVSLQGIKQAAKGHTGVASTKDASAAFFNPAGLALIDSKWSVSVGAFGIHAEADYQNRTTGSQFETSNSIGTPFSLYVSHKLSDKLAVGLGVYTPYGNTVTWEDNWAGQALIRDISLRAFFIQPTVSYKLNEWASVGAGLIYATGSVELNRAFVVAANPSGNVNLKSSKADGIGYNLGLMLKPHKKVQIGINYRSEVKMEADGDAKIVSNEGETLTNLTDKWKADLPLSAELTFGIAYMPTEKLTVEFDLNYAFWNSYKSLDFDFQDGNLPDSSSTRDYNNTFIYRVGASYAISDRWTGRLGAYYDESPSPDNYYSPETPTVDNRALTTGLSYNFKNGFSIDGTYMFLSGQERSFNNIETGWNGDLKVTTHIVGLGASYNF